MRPLLLLLTYGCTDKHDFADASNLCGTIERDLGTPEADSVSVLTVNDGFTACSGGDTGGPSWEGEEIAVPTPADDQFEATVDPGTYGVEVYSTDGGLYYGCAEAVVADTSTCSALISVRLAMHDTADEPNVYLYPPVPTDVEVRVPAWRQITASDPLYGPQGWRVRAHPNGRLQTVAGPRDFLFYERTIDARRLQTETGWCVGGAFAQASIEDALSDLGFLPNEIADFVEAWDPIFPDAERMTIYPQIDTLPALDISPPPDVLLRAWFLVADGCAPVEAPDLRPTQRTGFHAAEWGLVFDDSLAHPQVLVEGWREGG